MQDQDAGARGDFLTAAKLQSELITMSGLSLKCPWSEQEGRLFLMPEMCREVGVQIRPSSTLLQEAAAGWKQHAKIDEIMPNQSSGCSPGLKGDAWQVDVMPASLGRLLRAETMGDRGSRSEGLLPPWGYQS